MPSGISFKERLGVNDITDKRYNFWKAILAEFLGNVLLNFFGCASCLGLGNPKAAGDVVRIALAFGLTIFVLVQAFCHVSGGHLNPAVTFALLLNGRVSLLRALFYVIVQCLGAIVGSAILKALTPDDFDLQGNLGLTTLNPNLSPVQGFGVEFLLGYVLVMVVFAVCDPNRFTAQIVGPLSIGLTVGAGHLAAIPLTGSSMNPARSLGSAVVANTWSNHWIYWTGPICGGMVAGCTYQYLFSAPSKNSGDDYSPVQPEEREMALQSRK